jgi:hypothetical protein
VAADTPGLFGGTRDIARCDPSKMTIFLKAHRDLLAAWTSVLNIRPANFDSYVSGLTPVTLRADTAVTNHGFKNGRPTAIPAVLQAGTAVLADSHGLPVVKCFCGNPLTPPAAYSAAEYSGPRWTGFGQKNVISVRPTTTVIKVFVLIDIQTEKPFQRAVGTSGAQDQEYTGAAGGCGGAGPSPAGGGLQLVVIAGKISCGEARQVLNAYRADPQREGSSGSATVDGWKCGHYSIAGVEQSGDYESCQRGDVTIGTKLAVAVSAVSTAPISRQWAGTRLVLALLPEPYYFPGSSSPVAGGSGNTSTGNSGSTIAGRLGQVTELSAIDCNKITASVGPPSLVTSEAFPAENAYANTIVGNDVTFTTQITQFATAADASNFLAAIQAAAQGCTAAQPGSSNVTGISSAKVDGYPALGYSTENGRSFTWPTVSMSSTCPCLWALTMFRYPPSRRCRTRRTR